MDLDQLKRNRQQQNANLAQSEVARQDGVLANKTAFVTGIEDGQWIAKDGKGNTYNRAISHTNRGMGIGLTVDLTPSVGRSKVDAAHIDTIGTGSPGLYVYDEEAKVQIKTFPWIGATASRVDLFQDETVDLGDRQGVCYGDAFVYYDPDNPLPEVPEQQPYYVSCLSSGSIAIDSVLGDQTQTVRTATLPGAAYLGGTNFGDGSRVVSAFESSGVISYPGRSNSGDEQVDAVPVGGRCFAPSRSTVNTETNSSSGFDTVLNFRLATVVPTGNTGPGSLTSVIAYDDVIAWGYDESSRRTTTTNYSEEIIPVIAGKDLALYTSEEKGTQTVSSSRVGSSPTEDNDTIVEVEINNPNQPPTSGFFDNSDTRLNFFEQLDNDRRKYDLDPENENDPVSQFSTLSYGSSNVSSAEYKVNRPVNLQLIASSGSRFSDPYSIESKSPRAYGVTLVSGSLGQASISVRIDSGGYSGQAFALESERQNNLSGTQIVKLDAYDSGAHTTAGSLAAYMDAVPNITVKRGDNAVYPDSFTDSRYPSGGWTRPPFYIRHRNSGIYAEGGKLKTAPGLGRIRFKTETFPGGSENRYGYARNPKLIENDFTGTWLLVAQSTGQRYRLSFVGSGFVWATLPSSNTSPQSSPTLSLQNAVLDFLATGSEEIAWDAIAGDIADMAPNSLILYPESSPLPFDPEYTQLLPNNYTFTFTDRSGGDGPGLEN